MRVLIDSDVLLDVALAREPWGPSSRDLVNFCQLGGATGFVAWHSLSNVYYSISRERGLDGRGFIAGLLRFIQIVPTGNRDMTVALAQDMADLEDAMQVAAAVACKADRIVTRNLRHYGKSPVPAVTPAEFLASKGSAWRAADPGATDLPPENHDEGETHPLG
jgi:predicted nucleic acid-binding protein